jgi:hypothetical protein
MTLQKSRDSSVGIVTDWKDGVRFAAGASNFSLLHSVHPASYPMGTGVNYLYIHSPVGLHGLLLNWLSTGTTLLLRHITRLRSSLNAGGSGNGRGVCAVLTHIGSCPLLSVSRGQRVRHFHKQSVSRVSPCKAEQAYSRCAGPNWQTITLVLVESFSSFRHFSGFKCIYFLSP